MSEERCDECGERLREDAKYCRECGTRVTSQTLQDENTIDSEDVDQRENGGPHPWTDEDVENGKLLAAVSHLLTLVTWLFGPLIIMLVSENPFVVQNAKNAVMWQLMVTVYFIIAGLLVVILVGIPLLFALWFLNLAFVIIATVRASEGTAWQYPLTPAV